VPTVSFTDKANKMNHIADKVNLKLMIILKRRKSLFMCVYFKNVFKINSRVPAYA
jgi:hypothetical protein